VNLRVSGFGRARIGMAAALSDATQACIDPSVIGFSTENRLAPSKNLNRAEWQELFASRAITGVDLGRRTHLCLVAMGRLPSSEVTWGEALGAR
jgi:hypothetical protein